MRRRLDWAGAVAEAEEDAGADRRRTQGLRQSINANYNWATAAADNVNIFPQLGGKTASDSQSLQAGYTIGYHRLTSIFNVELESQQ